MNDEYPVEEPGLSTPPRWAALPTMPWTRAVPPSGGGVYRAPQMSANWDPADTGELPTNAPPRAVPPRVVPPMRMPAPPGSAPPRPPLRLVPPIPRQPTPPRPVPDDDDTGELPVVPTAPEPTPPAQTPPEPTTPEPTPPAQTAPEPTAPLPTPPEPTLPEPTSPAPVRPPDPEQDLANYAWRYDPDTLHEIVEGDQADELRDIRDRLTAKLNTIADNPGRARLLSLRAVVSRILGDLHKALSDGKLALAHAEATGELRRIAIAQARLAHVLQWSGEYEEADRLFTLANSTELPDRLRATMHHHAGKCAYDQGRYMEACNHFELALDLRKEEDPDLIAHTEMALDAVFRRVAEHGWGPYPRVREEVLQTRRPPVPAFDEYTRRWGYADADGNLVVPAQYAEVQPFRDGVAWGLHPGARAWELIDDTGRVLIPPTAGYLGVSGFSDGLAWVSRDGTGGWIGIDKANTVLIPIGFDDVRPFRRGLAAVRRGRWGAVDGLGRVVLPFRFDGFATALCDGRYIDGFSDEGLAVVSLGGRKGVVDRAGRMIVQPAYPVLVIHPVAFLFVDGARRWGALDRRGQRLLEPTYPSRTAVTDEIDRLLADTRPVL